MERRDDRDRAGDPAREVANVAHLRLRKFNTRDAYPEQTLDNDLCMAVRAGNTVYLRGQTAQDLDGKIVGIGDPAAQTENAMKCVKILLEEAGGQARGHRQDHDLHHRSRLPRAGLPSGRNVAEGRLSGVDRSDRSGLAKPEYLMEIDVIAEIPADRAERAEATITRVSGAAMTDTENTAPGRAARTGGTSRAPRDGDPSQTYASPDGAQIACPRDVGEREYGMKRFSSHRSRSRSRCGQRPLGGRQARHLDLGRQLEGPGRADRSQEIHRRHRRPRSNSSPAAPSTG